MGTSNVPRESPTDPTPEQKTYVLEKQLRWRRRRETWPPVVTVVVSSLALLILIAQSLIYNQQRQIMSRQVKDDEDSQRALVSVASIKANLIKGEILLLLENSGRLPAKNIKVEAKEYRQSNIVVGSKTPFDAGQVSLFPGSFKMRVVVVMGKFKPEEAAAIQARSESLVVIGKVQYENGFGPAETFFAFEYSPPNNEDWTAMSNSAEDLEPSLELRAYNVSHNDGVTVVTALLPQTSSEIVRRTYSPTPNALWKQASTPLIDLSRRTPEPTPYATSSQASTPIVASAGKTPIPIAHQTVAPTQETSKDLQKRVSNAGCNCSCTMTCGNRCEFTCTGCGEESMIDASVTCCEAAHDAIGDIGPCQPETSGSKRKKVP